MEDTSESESDVSTAESGTTSEAGEVRMSSEEIAVIHLNAQSIRNKISELTHETEGYNVICVTETWLNQDIQSSSISIPGYQEIYRKDRDGNTYGGVGMYIRSGLISKSRTDLDIRNLEAIWAEIQTGGKKLLVCAVYRPPNAGAEVWDLFEESLNQAKTTGISHILMLGDKPDTGKLPYDTTGQRTNPHNRDISHNIGCDSHQLIRPNEASNSKSTKSE